MSSLRFPAKLPLLWASADVQVFQVAVQPSTTGFRVIAWKEGISPGNLLCNRWHWQTAPEELGTFDSNHDETPVLALTLRLISAPQSRRFVPAGCSPGARNRRRATEASTSPTSRRRGGTAWRCAPSSTARGPNSCTKALDLWPCDGVAGYSDLDLAGLTSARQTVTCLRLALFTLSRSKLNKRVFKRPVEGALLTPWSGLDMSSASLDVRKNRLRDKM